MFQFYRSWQSWAESGLCPHLSSEIHPSTHPSLTAPALSPKKNSGKPWQVVEWLTVNWEADSSERPCYRTVQALCIGVSSHGLHRHFSMKSHPFCFCTLSEDSTSTCSSFHTIDTLYMWPFYSPNPHRSSIGQTRKLRPYPTKKVTYPRCTGQGHEGNLNQCLPSPCARLFPRAVCSPLIDHETVYKSQRNV